ncbi:MAG TPA: pyruvate dehydrogenase complex dihydrolipoamide acetyltransferase [Pyrinomonadaceae bacterium]|nr:pyruvate dehydrogenase complex dihydrolipoamide acetyltransferase [Pyrinomonadaceae bacterium]
MANTIIMPKLSPTMEEGQISRWLKKEGDTIEANEPIAEVDTDKATMEVTSLEAGTLLKIVIGDGDNARLGETIGVIGEKGEDFSALLSEASTNGAGKVESQKSKVESPSETSAPADEAQEKTAEPASEKEETVAKQGEQELRKEISETEGRSYEEQRPEAKEDAAIENPKSKTQNPKSENGRLIVSPIAARMASENDINLKSIKGSGPNGRIIKRDIESALAEVRSPASKVQSQETATSFAQGADIQGASAFREENTSKMRQIIAQRLAASIGPIPTFYLTVEIEMDKALELRKQINSSIKEEEKVSVNDIIVKVAAMASLKHPFVNSSYQDKTIRFYEDADVGVAVAIDEGLITPVVRGANRKGIAEISKEIKEMAGRARDKKLQPEEYTGATFSISNLGMFGIEQFTAIINPPEAAIFAIGSSAPKAVVRDGEIVIRNLMNVTMSCDHRVIDGATGAKFLQTFKQMLENPILMLM